MFTDGWKEDVRDYGCFMHIQVREDGLIYIRRDGTDLDIGQQILETGVQKKEMIIGFHSPMMQACHSVGNFCGSFLSFRKRFLRNDKARRKRFLQKDKKNPCQSDLPAYLHFSK